MLKRFIYFYNRYPTLYFFLISFSIFFFAYDGSPMDTGFYFLFFLFSALLYLLLYLQRGVMYSHFSKQSQEAVKFQNRTFDIYAGSLVLLVPLKPLFYDSSFLKFLALLIFTYLLSLAVAKRLYSKDFCSILSYLLVQNLFLILAFLLIPILPFVTLIILI